MGIRKLITFAAFVLAGVSLVAVPAPAHAADKLWSYGINTGGTYIKVFDGTVNSDFTAMSSVSGDTNSANSTNTTAGVDVSKLARVGAVETSSNAEVTSASTVLSSVARTADVNLLNGLITVDAVETAVTTTAKPDGSVTFAADSKLLGIHIAGVNLPVTIPKNFNVNIPGVAQVTLNYGLNGTKDNTVATLGWGLAVTLLAPRDGYSAGVTVMLNPVQHFLGEFDPSPGATLYGGAYGSKVDVQATGAVEVISNPTAYTGTPKYSSKGATLHNSTVGVNLPSVLTTGVVKTTSTSTRETNGDATIVNTSSVAGINLLGGLVKADAIEVTATGTRENGVWTHTEEMKLVNLVVAGQVIPVNVGANTSINVAGVGLIEINKRIVSKPNQLNMIRGLKITLDTAQLGLPVGAVIEVGVAGTGMTSS